MMSTIIKLFFNELTAIFCFVLIGARPLYAKCIVSEKYDLIKKSRFIAVIEILKVNFTAKELYDCKGIKKLRYEVRVTNNIGKPIPKGIYVMNDDYNCEDYETHTVFEQKNKYIASINRITEKEIFIETNSCEDWGWQFSKKQEIFNSVNILCKEKYSAIEKDLELSRECSKDSDCTYMSFISPYRSDMSCHQFVNKDKVSDIQSKIDSLEDGVCAPEKYLLCKEHLKKLIKCIKKQCSFIR